MEDENLFEEVSQGVVLAGRERLVPSASAYQQNPVAILFPSAEAGKQFIADSKDEMEDCGSDIQLLSVENVWSLMRRAAGEGIGGFVCLGSAEEFKCHFMFMNRVEEAGNLLPTILTAINSNGWGPSLTRTGVKELTHAELLHWNRFDLLDPVSATWSMRSPFRDWEQGQPFYEICAKGTILAIANVPLLGDWNSPQGAIPFFTCKEEAEHFIQCPNCVGRYGILQTPEAEIPPPKVREMLQVVAVKDLAKRFQDISNAIPMLPFCINPHSRRENSAYAALNFDSIMGLWKGADDNDELSPRIIAVSGTWKLLPENSLEHERPFESWSGTDTIGWSGGQSLQLLPLDRSFAPLGVDCLGVDTQGISQSEAEEVVATFLDSGNFPELISATHNCCEKNNGRLNLFFLVEWDVVTGDAIGSPWIAGSFFGLLQILAAYEREHDRDTRIHGAQSCFQIGFQGSANEEEEDIRGQRFLNGLRRLGVRTLIDGYRPKDCADLVALCNATLKTLHVEYAGCAKDLLWASDSEQVDRILEDLSIESDEWEDWRTSAEPMIDSRGSKLCRELMGSAVWESLVPFSRHFLATAVCYLEEQGHAPQVDYAPISIEVVKALEVEFGEIFAAFRGNLGKELHHDESDHGDASLAAFVGGGTPPTIGTMSYLMRNPGAETSELRKALWDFLCSLRNAGFLTSNRFLKRDMQKIINKYRNGGAHDMPISEEVCRECVSKLVGNREEPGIISKVVEWKMQ